jgi:hypothetical protein
MCFHLKEQCHEIFDFRFFYESVSLTPVENLPPVSTTPAVPMAKFATVVVDTGGAPLLANIPRIFEKIQYDPNVIFGGLG